MSTSPSQEPHHEEIPPHKGASVKTEFWRLIYSLDAKLKEARR